MEFPEGFYLGGGGGGGLGKKNLFYGGRVNIFWNYTLVKASV